MKTLDKTTEKHIEEILNKYKEHEDIVNKAIDFIYQKHENQTRKSGEPYVSHPIAVASILSSIGMDYYSVVAGLLHDVVEDTDTTVDEIKREFGPQIASLVDGLTKIDKYKFSSKEQAKAENYRKMLFAMSKDVRVIVIKLADRLHNMRTLDYMPRHKQLEIAKETIDIYAPIAHRLGIWSIKKELEDLYLKYTHPEEYEKIKDFVQKISAESEVYLKKYFIPKVVEAINDFFKDKKPNYTIQYRQKHIYSIYQKLKRKNLSLEDLQDILGIRVIVEDVAECYTVLGIVHSIFRPIPGSFDDYISLPKPNMYQSLHTAVEGPKKRVVEVQIRTYEMHERAEKGIAAHWAYKENSSTKDNSIFAWLREVLNSIKTKNANELIEAVKDELFEDEVFVFTPKDDVIVLPKGATVLDFAYYIHTYIGNHCQRAIVNNKIVPLSYTLQSGDRVEIITNSSQSPKIEWLKMVTTKKAKTRIRLFLKAKEKEVAVEEGQKTLLKLSDKLGVSFEDMIKNLTSHFDLNEQELFASVGFGKIPINRVIKLFSKEKEQKHIKDEGKEGSLKLESVSNVLFSVAKCCMPIPGDPVMGVISKNAGIVIHHEKCPNLQYAVRNIPQKVVKIDWKNQDKLYNTRVRVIASDRPGILSEVSSAFTKSNINIIEASTKTNNLNIANMDFKVQLKSVKDLKRAFDEIKSIKGVETIKRVFG
jgi:RelA/SpoT family (p)ppGpp synthetase